MIYVIDGKNYIRVSSYYREVTVEKVDDNYVVKPVLKDKPIFIKNTDRYEELTPKEVYLKDNSDEDNFEMPVRKRKIKEDII